MTSSYTFAYTSIYKMLSHRRSLYIAIAVVATVFINGCGGSSSEEDAPSEDISDSPVLSPAPSLEPTPSPSTAPEPSPSTSPVPALPPAEPTPSPVVTQPTPSPTPVASPVIEPSPNPIATAAPSPLPETPTPTPSVMPVIEALDRSVWTLTASNNEADLTNAIDGDESTRWTTRETQRPNQWLAVDLGEQHTLNRVVLASESSPNDYPRVFEVHFSDDGVTWTIANSGVGEKATTVITLDNVTAHHLKIVQLGSSDQYWWSSHELNIYGVTDGEAPSPTPSVSPSPNPLPEISPSPSPSTEPTPSPSPSPSDYELGVAVYAQHCESCHRPIEVSDKRNRNETEIRQSLINVAAMRSISLSDDDITRLVLALNTEPGATPSPSPVITPPTDEASLEIGYSLYESKGCAVCHGNIADSSKRGAEAVSIAYALENEVEMEGLSVSEVEIASIVLALADDEGICRAPTDPGPVVMRRLSNDEYANTVRDLLGVDIDPDSLPGDSSAGNFTNIGSANVNSEHAIGYAAVVPEIADAINDTNNPIAQNFVTCDVNNSGTTCAQAIIENLLPYAFRRDVDTEEAAEYLTIYQTAISAGLDNSEALAITVEAILLSPHFTFIVEIDQATGDIDSPTNLNEFELATRLSYFLWSSMPDDTLFDLARAGELSEVTILNEQIDRMLADPKSQALVDIFFAQWMRLVEFADPNSTEYAYIDAQLRQDMLEETKQLFSNQFLTSNSDMRELLTTETTYLNNNLANHYDLSPPGSEGFAETPLTQGRVGLLGHASLLSATSKENETQPVARGKWVLDELLCESPRTPPPDVGALPETPDPNLTLKEQLAAHRSDPACATCHTTMDPLGFGFENFDELGHYRSVYDNGHVVDSSGELPDGRVFNGIEELSSVLASDPRYMNCVTEKFLSYARGALVGARDNCRVKQIAETAADSGFSVNAVIKAIVNDAAFLTRRSTDADDGEGL